MLRKLSIALVYISALTSRLKPSPQSQKLLFRGMQKARQHKTKLSLDQTST
jgi:hypothetical protein